MAVQARAEAEAEGFRNQGAGLSRQLAEEDIGRIEEIRSSAEPLLLLVTTQ